MFVLSPQRWPQRWQTRPAILSGERMETIAALEFAMKGGFSFVKREKGRWIRHSDLCTFFVACASQLLLLICEWGKDVSSYCDGTFGADWHCWHVCFFGVFFLFSCFVLFLCTSFLIFSQILVTNVLWGRLRTIVFCMNGIKMFYFGSFLFFSPKY